MAMETSSIGRDRLLVEPDSGMSIKKLVTIPARWRDDGQGRASAKILFFGSCKRSGPYELSVLNLFRNGVNLDFLIVTDRPF
jgi:hypothetical protein